MRNIILEIIYRLPQTEALKEYVPELCKALMKILRVENEDNAVVCVKIIIDLHRSFRQVLEDQVQPFLDIVQEIFQNMEQTVKDSFDNPDLITTVRVIYSLFISVKINSFSIASFCCFPKTNVPCCRYT